MWMYSKRDVKNIVEDFLAKYLNLDSVFLSEEFRSELRKICYNYGIEVKDIEEQY